MNQKNNGVGSERQFRILFKTEYLFDLEKIPLTSLYLSLFSLEIKITLNLRDSVRFHVTCLAQCVAQE